MPQSQSPHDSQGPRRGDSLMFRSKSRWTAAGSSSHLWPQKRSETPEHSTPVEAISFGGIVPQTCHPSHQELPWFSNRDQSRL